MALGRTPLASGRALHANTLHRERDTLWASWAVGRAPLPIGLALHANTFHRERDTLWASGAVGRSWAVGRALLAVGRALHAKAEKAQIEKHFGFEKDFSKRRPELRRILVSGRFYQRRDLCEEGFWGWDGFNKESRLGLGIYI